MTIDPSSDVTPYTGYSITAPQSRFLREALKGTDVIGAPTKILLYRPTAAGAAAAAASLGEGVTATALYPGVRGNDISIVVTESVDKDGVFVVDTLVDGVQADQQTVTAADALRPNNWVSFSGSGPLTATAGVTLTGGADGTVSPAAYPDFLTALEPYSFDVLVYDGTDGAVRDGGETLTAQDVVWWLAGAEAGAQYYQSLSCAAYPGAVDVLPRLTGSQIEAAILGGDIVLSEEFGQVRVETDINTLTTYTEEIGEIFHKNRSMRVCNTLANDIYREFSLHYKGKLSGTVPISVLDADADMLTFDFSFTYEDFEVLSRFNDQPAQLGS